MKSNSANALVFVTNQELRLAERQNQVVPFQVEVDKPGIWSAQVLIGDSELVRQYFEVYQSS